MELTPQHILDFFKAQTRRPVSVRELLDVFDLHRGSQRMVLALMMQLVGEGKLVRLRKKNFILPETDSTVSGLLQVSNRGAGFLIGAAPGGGDLFIHRSNLASAVDGDRVEAEVFPGTRGRRQGRSRDEGRITNVLERAHETMVGQIVRTGTGATLTPRNLKIGRWIELRNPPARKEAPDRAWILVRIVQWTEGLENPLIAEFQEMLGMPGDRGISILVMLRDLGIDPDFPPQVLHEAKNLAPPQADDELNHRRDLRQETIFTIDPATAKDFDDAVSIQTLQNGNWRLGVHIADVAHYIAPGTPLDIEALRRATSIYPVDRVVPMLPERLSNELCSLRPREDRCAMSVFMEITPKAQVENVEILPTLIHSKHRLNYREVQDYFDDPKGRDQMHFADIGQELLDLRDLAQALTKARMQRGALDLDMPEALIECNEQGDTLSVHRSERLDSMRLIEECMIAANEAVARHMGKNRLPALYRIHDAPDPGGLQRIAPALAVFGVRVPKNAQPTPETYQPIVNQLQAKDGGHIGQALVLRTLMRAQYAPANRGHFGLASKAYCHFTSPIRRYPDLLVHRVIKASLSDNPDAPRQLEETRAALDEIAGQSNRMADQAMHVERQAADIKTMEYMQDQIGDIFDAWIAAIVRRGFFAQLVEAPIDGFVAARSLTDDYYAPDPDRIRLIGRRTNRTYTLGQRLRVRVVRVNPEEGEMDLEPVEPRKTHPKPKKRKRKKQ